MHVIINKSHSYNKNYESKTYFKQIFKKIPKIQLNKKIQLLRLITSRAELYHPNTYPKHHKEIK